jgi:hypothetical protein
MLAAAVSLALMVGVLFKYGLRDEPPPATKAPTPTPALPGSTPLGNTLPGSAASDVNEPHAGTVHHTEEPHQGTTAVPDLFATSRVGDWHAYESLIESSMTPKPVTNTTTVWVSAADDNQVTRVIGGPTEADKATNQTDQVPRQGLTLDHLTTNAELWRIYEVSITDEDHTVGGRSFKCKKITYSSRKSDEPNRVSHTELWISDEVPAGGLVEQRDVHEGADFKLTRRLIGFGDAKTTRWGKKPAS